MSLLTLVRHGQASFDADDYDRLSALGEQQARLLGQYWANQRVAFDEVYTGPRSRQQKSAELVGMGLEQGGLVWPEPVILSDLDEYDLEGLLKRLAPRLVELHPEFAQLMKDYQCSVGEQNRLRDFQRMFESLLRHWQSAELPDEGIESWAAFRNRVDRVIRRVQEQSGRGRRVVVFTSGGFIGGATQQALKVSDSTALELNWRIRNCSLTEFVYTRDRFSLDSFNTIPHLSDAALWTYR
jgi:broad specificity phosphatase PhoE